MKNRILAVSALLALHANVFAGGPDPDVLRVASWLIGSFDNRMQVAADRAASSPNPHEAATMIGRPVQDPVEFQDALYLYMETRREGEARPYRQQVYRLKKSGSQVRIEVLRIDAQLLDPLGTDAQMLGNLSPGDLRKEEGCDLLLEFKGGEFVGSTAPRTCRSGGERSAYVVSTLRLTPELIQVLERGYDAKGVQTSGPSDGRPYEFRRAPK